MKKTERARPYPHYLFNDEIIAEVKPMKSSDCGWYGVKTGSYEITCKNYGWFPTEILCGVVNGKYTDTNNLGVTISGNMGSRSIAVIKIDEAIEMLKATGMKIYVNQ